MGKRVGELERRIRGRLPASGDGKAREHLSGLLDRFARAKQAGVLTEELEAEGRAVQAALRRGIGSTRGEGER